MSEALCFLCFLSIVYLQTYPSVRYRGVLPAGVAYATPATAYTVWVASLTVPAVVSVSGSYLHKTRYSHYPLQYTPLKFLREFPLYDKYA